jgi:lipid-A-disaccharide synthase
MAKNILIASGEASGDLHGSFLIKALKRLEPELTVKGMGGEKMRAAGLEGVDSTPLSVVGIVEVLEKFPKILKTLLDRESFDCVVLIDYPDFNLRLAKEAKKRGIPVIYYISPQVWAWRKNSDEGVDVEYVGHPLADLAVCDMTKAQARQFLRIGTETTCVALLPGSRSSEVRRHLEPMARAAQIIEQRLGPKIVTLLPAADGIEDGLLNELLKDLRGKVKIVRGRLYESLRASDAAVVASGTATLQTALIGTPMVIVYRVSAITYMIGRLLIDVEHIGMPNIVAGRKVVPELIQYELTPENIAGELFGILTDRKRRDSMREALGGIRQALGGHGAAEKAAAAIYTTLGGRVSGVKQGGAPV